MADFCNQCARDMGFPEGDLSSDRPTPESGMGYPDLCEGCGPCLVDEKGNCVDPICLKSHGCLLVAERIMEAFKLAVNSPDYIDMLSMPGGQHNILPLMNKIATAVCGEHYQYKLVQQIHDEYVVEVSFKPHPQIEHDLIDEGFSALATLQDMHEGDEQEVLDTLKELEAALQYALELKQTIIDMDKWVGENEGIGCCDYVDYDTDVNTTRSYLLAKELTKVNKVKK